jgi:hypothetical protein
VIIVPPTKQPMSQQGSGAHVPPQPLAPPQQAVQWGVQPQMFATPDPSHVS